MTVRTLRHDDQGRLLKAGLLDDPALIRLMAMLDRDGEEARVVGGAVRNALLGVPLGDIDITTTALPETVMARAKAARLRAIPTGIAHGTVTVLVGAVPFEVTTLREDVETDGRHAVVRFGRDFALDAQRRDFTINALSVSGDGTIHDTTNGLADLAAGRVRFIGDADRRIREDFLRVLRFFRFSAGYATGPIDAEGLAASARHKEALAGLSRERIRAELLKLLASAGAPEVLAVMTETGIAGVVLGAEPMPGRVQRLAEIEAARESAPDPLLRLAAFAVRSVDDVRRLRELLRLSNAEQDRLAGALAARAQLNPALVPDRGAIRGLLFRCGRAAALDGLDLAAADGVPDALADWLRVRQFAAVEPPPQLPLGGNDIMARGVGGGRLVGAVLKRLQADWIRAGFPQEPEKLAALLDGAIKAEQTR